MTVRSDSPFVADAARFHHEPAEALRDAHPLARLVHIANLLATTEADKTPLQKQLDGLSKIIATIGPACSSPDMLKAMIKTGMNVARLNLSHGSHDGHRQQIELLALAFAVDGAAQVEHRDAVMAAQHVNGLDTRFVQFTYPAQQVRVGLAVKCVDDQSRQEKIVDRKALVGNFWFIL